MSAVDSGSAIREAHAHLYGHAKPDGETVKTAVRPRGCWGVTRHKRSRLHLVDGCWALWHPEKTLFIAKFRCGDGTTKVRLFIDPPDAYVLCDKCVLAIADHYVYRFDDQDGCPLYVGYTRCLFERVRAHAKNAEWWPLVRNYSLSEYPTEQEARDAEMATIRSLRPRFNRLGVISRRAS